MDSSINKKNKIVEYIIIFSFLLYVTDIFLISNLGQDLNLRIQDIASVFAAFTPVYIINKCNKNNKSFSYIIISIILFLVYVIISNLIFYVKGNIDEMFVFYIGKEIEFFLCMLSTIYFLKHYDKAFYKILNILMIFNILYGFYQVITGTISYYCIGTIFEKAPSISGMIYFVSSIISFFMYKKLGENKFKFFSILTYILTVFTISKTSILGLTIFYISFFISETLYKIGKTIRGIEFKTSFKKVLFIVCVLILLIIFAIVFLNSRMINNILSNTLVKKILYRFKLLGSSYSYRKNKTKSYYDYFIGESILSMFFGCGKGITEFAFDSQGLGVDNQFVRGIIELGLIGIVIWLGIIFSIINFIKKSKSYTSYRFCISLFIAYLCMGVGYEVFVVTKAGIIFWFLLGVFISEGI